MGRYQLCIIIIIIIIITRLSLSRTYIPPHTRACTKCLILLVILLVSDRCRSTGHVGRKSNLFDVSQSRDDCKASDVKEEALGYRGYSCYGDNDRYPCE